MDSTEFFGGEQRTPGLDDDKDGYGRYMLDVDGKGRKPYTRSTTIAKMLDDTSGLAIWQQRKAAKGVAQSPALVARAAVTPLDDKQSWREILAQAEVKSGGDEKRDLGSAFHALHEHVATMTDDEWLSVPSDLRATYVKYRAELERLGIEEVLIEGTCANTAIGSAGKFDAIFRLADGRLVIGDRKSGRITEYPHSAAVQLAIYAYSDVLIEWDENGATVRHPMPTVDRTIAIVVDVKIGDENTASVHVYEIDIWAGWAAALESARIRRWRNRRDLITPYHPEFVPSDRARNAAARPIEPTKRIVTDDSGVDWVVPENATVAEIVANVGNDAAHTLRTVPADYETPRATPEQRAAFAAELPPSQVKMPTEVAHGPAANADHRKQVWSSAQGKNITVDAQGNEVVPAAPTLADAAGAQADAGAGDVAALLGAFKTKAQLQGVLSKVAGPGANLARQRKNLAADIVSHPTWPQRRTEFLAIDDGEPDGRAADSPYVGDVADEQADAETFSPVVSNAPGPVPPDPEPGYAPPAQPASLFDNPFSQAATAESASVVEPIEDQLLRRIGEATSVGDLEVIWNSANESGIGWPPRLHQAATLRQKQLTAPAAN